MNKKYSPLLPFLALALLSLSNISYAQNAYTSGSAPGAVYALSQQGRVIYSTPSSYYSPNYFLSGTNGNTSSAVSLNTPAISSPYFSSDPGLSSFSFDPSAVNYASFNYQNPAIFNVPSSSIGGSQAAGDPDLTGFFSGSGFNSLNDNNQIAANFYIQGQTDTPYEGYSAGIANLSNHTVTIIGGSAVYGLNSSGIAVINYQQTSITNSSTGAGSSIGGAIALVNTNTGALTTVQGLGYGGLTVTNNLEGNFSGTSTTQQVFNDSSGINATGQVTGGLYTSALQTYTINYATGTTTIDSNGSGATRAFRTGDNGSGTQMFGTANGISSMGTAINSSGQVGGYITLASGQTEAFLSTARGGLMVGLGAGASTDSTTVEFLNDNGQAIIYDSTTGIYYLYSAGYIVPVSSLTGQQETVSSGQCTANCVVGFNNLGQILLDGNAMLTPTSSNWGSAAAMSAYSGATLISSTSQFSSIASAQNGTTPSSAFYTDPSTSTSTIAAQSVSTPGPATIGLMLLALMALGGINLKRNYSV